MPNVDTERRTVSLETLVAIALRDTLLKNGFPKEVLATKATTMDILRLHELFFPHEKLPHDIEKTRARVKGAVEEDFAYITLWENEYISRGNLMMHVQHIAETYLNGNFKVYISPNRPSAKGILRKRGGHLRLV